MAQVVEHLSTALSPRDGGGAACIWQTHPGSCLDVRGCAGAQHIVSSGNRPFSLLTHRTSRRAVCTRVPPPVGICDPHSASLEQMESAEGASVPWRASDLKPARATEPETSK
jgi:hypothetical protein